VGSRAVVARAVVPWRVDAPYATETKALRYEFEYGRALEIDSVKPDHHKEKNGLYFDATR